MLLEGNLYILAELAPIGVSEFLQLIFEVLWHAIRKHRVFNVFCHFHIVRFCKLTTHKVHTML